MPPVPLWRLYVLRLFYLLIFVLVPSLSWAKLIDPSQTWTASDPWGVVVCMLAAFSLLCCLGLRYPLQMLPLLFWELVWKMIWMIRVALPLWMDGKVDQALVEGSFNIGLGALLLLVIPWRYVAAQYLRRPGDPWRKEPSMKDAPRYG